jgi:hypothetical protein
MTTNKQKTSNEYTADSADEVRLIIKFFQFIFKLSLKIKTHSHRLLLPDTELLSAPDEEDEIDLDEETTEYKNPEKDFLLSPSPPILITNTVIPIRPWSNFSLATTSIPTKSSLSRSYKYIQLERLFTSANLLKTRDERIKFEHEYLQSLDENKFE